MSASTRLDKFVPKLLALCEHAHGKGIRQFQFRHLNGDLMLAKVEPDGRVEVTRLVRAMGGTGVVPFPFKLSTSLAQLRADVASGIASNQAELFRG